MSRKNQKSKRRRRNKPVRQKRSPLALVMILLLGAALGALASTSLPRVTASLLPLAEILREIRITAPEWPSIEGRLRTEELSLDRIEFMGLQVLEAEELWARSGLTRARPLVDISPGQVCERIQEHPRVKHCAATRVPPTRLLIEIEERLAIGRLERPALALDRDGERFPLRGGEARTLPIVRGKVEPALALIAAARSLEEPLAVVIAESARAVWFIPRGESVRVRVGTKPKEALQTWRRVKQSGLLGGSEVEDRGEIDLRFEGNAVLRNFARP